MGYPATAVEIQQRMQTLSALGGHQVFVVTAGNGKLLGWAHVTHVRHLMEPDFAELIGLVVDENERSHHIGAQLLELSERWAVEQGLLIMWVRSNVIRHDAHRFYLKHGYTVLKDQRLFIKELSSF